MRKVALLIESSTSYGRGLLRGIARYNRERADWSTYFQPEALGGLLPSWLENWNGDGIVARVDSLEMVRILENTRLPVVNLRTAWRDLPFPCVCLDNQVVARLAADHLLHRGLKHFGFCGNARGLHQMLDRRGDEFRRLIEQAGYRCDVFPADPSGRGPVPWEQGQETLAAWIDTLPVPVGIMASNDERGLMVLDACRRRQRRVPDDLAVIGVDNDEYLCDLSVPPLTSIDVNAEQIGGVAAELLDGMMSGRQAPTEPIVVPPRGIVTRRSTDVLASEDPVVNRAVSFIRANAARGLQVPEVAAYLHMSRASVEPRIKRILGRTIHQEIQWVRVERVKEMLIGGSLPLKQIATAAGFSSVQYMVRVFRGATKETPARFRARRHGTPAPHASNPTVEGLYVGTISAPVRIVREYAPEASQSSHATLASALVVEGKGGSAVSFDPGLVGPVGLIGVGLMGKALAGRLASYGIRVIAYDGEPGRCREVEAVGGHAVADAPAVFRGCDRVLLSLPNSDVVQSVLARAEKHLRRGHLVIDTTTGVPADAVAIGHRLAKVGVAYVDATISGSSAQVSAAEAVVLAGGEREAFERCMDLFRLFARKAFHVGPCGSGSTMKLLVNLVLGVNRAALAEGLAFAKVLGLDPAEALVVLKESAAYSRIMDGKGEKMLTGDFSPQAKLSQHLKDVRIILAEAAAAGTRLPLSEAHRYLLELAESAGFGNLDNSAVIRAFDQLTVRKVVK